MRCNIVHVCSGLQFFVFVYFITAQCIDATHTDQTIISIQYLLPSCYPCFPFSVHCFTKLPHHDFISWASERPPPQFFIMFISSQFPPTPCGILSVSQIILPSCLVVLTCKVRNTDASPRRLRFAIICILVFCGFRVTWCTTLTGTILTIWADCYAIFDALSWILLAWIAWVVL